MNKLTCTKNMFPKRIFDPSKRKDMQVYAEFVRNNNWGTKTCPFELEWPWLNIPNMIEYKISQHAIRRFK